MEKVLAVTVSKGRTLPNSSNLGRHVVKHAITPSEKDEHSASNACQVNEEEEESIELPPKMTKNGSGNCHKVTMRTRRSKPFQQLQEHEAVAKENDMPQKQSRNKTVPRPEKKADTQEGQP